MNSTASLKKMLIHMGIVVGLSVSLVLMFFYVYLPATTNHGETITVPDVKGMSLNEMEDFLVKRGLRYEINDSSYSDKHPPLTIIKQFPKAGSKVKETRKIFLSVNRVNPPTVPMPNLIDGPLKNAQVVLKSNELKIGEISFKPDLAFNAVLEQKWNGKEIKQGTRIPKGSTIDLVVGNGYGSTVQKLPDFRGYVFDEARFYIKGRELEVGIVHNAGDSLEAPGYVYKQSPQPDTEISIGSSVDLWIIPKYDSTKFEYYDKIFKEQENQNSEI
ncbi:MAG TPA: PASTA domain-containing protein [Ignavibacteriaceae bacterium]